MIFTIILRKDSDDFKGEFIAVHNRTKEIIKNFPNDKVRVFVLREHFNFAYRLLRPRYKARKVNSFIFDNIEYTCLWFNFSIIDNIRGKLNKKPIITFKRINRFISKCIESDMILAHGLYAGTLALSAKEQYCIPYTVTWHGTDIHTLPMKHSFYKEQVTSIINNAECNCYVSKDLMNKSCTLSQQQNSIVLYNGVDKAIFRRFSDNEISNYRKLYDLSETQKHVAFIGNFYAVKNILSLPKVFRLVQDSLGEDKIEFHFIGDGTQKGELVKQCHEYDIKFRIWGNQHTSKMASIINCMNLVVLPSINEGLPLVVLESLSCGVPVIGSRIGGIPEAIGIENTVSFGDGFDLDFSQKIIESLSYSRRCNISPNFSWSNTGRIEKELIEGIINKFNDNNAPE